MKNILVLGALPKNHFEINLYNVIIEVAKKYSEIVNSPIDTANFKGSDQERYDRAFELVANADLVIGEQSKPSTGQGMEIRECTILNKPLIVVAKEGSKVSGLVKGCPATKELIFYTDLNDLKLKLKESISSLN